VNDVFGYCDGEPDWDLNKPERIGMSNFTVVRCLLKPAKCGKYLTLEASVGSYSESGSSRRDNLPSATGKQKQRQSPRVRPGSMSP